MFQFVQFSADCGAVVDDIVVVVVAIEATKNASKGLAPHVARVKEAVAIARDKGLDLPPKIQAAATDYIRQHEPQPLKKKTATSKVTKVISKQPKQVPAPSTQLQWRRSVHEQLQQIISYSSLNKNDYVML